MEENGKVVVNAQRIRLYQDICDQLSERNAVLFLGAGVNYGVLTDNGVPFPLGSGLAAAISREILQEDFDERQSLRYVAAMAISKIGLRDFNNHLFKLLSGFIPGRAHLSLVQMPWDAIYTTNYDLLVEEAAGIVAAEPKYQIVPIVSQAERIDQFTDLQIPYYKLHGSIDRANSESGRLVVTQNDYRLYEEQRRPLLRRLKLDLKAHSCVFVGYSLNDENILGVIDDIRRENGVENLPQSYLIRNSFSDSEKSYWRYNYNIHLVSADAEEFLSELREVWTSEQRVILTADEIRSRNKIQIDSSAAFSKVSESFYRVRPQDCVGASDPDRFFRGAPPLWSDIRDRIAPARSMYWDLYESLLPEITDRKAPAKAYIVLGPAGTGKTTLLKMLAYEYANSRSLTVLWHIPGTPIESRHISFLANEADCQRIVVFIDHAGAHVRDIERLLWDSEEKSLPITVVLEERHNQWLVALENRGRQPAVQEYLLGALDDEEIDPILDALRSTNNLGLLSGTSVADQRRHFDAVADHDLLVALRELTELTSFDEIIRDEYEHIPSEMAKEAYGYISALGQFDQYIRYETLTRLLKVSFEQMRSAVFAPTRGVLVDVEEYGRSRTDVGYRLRPRHPIIASVVFGLMAQSDEDKLRVVLNIINYSDPGHDEDMGVLRTVARDKRLVDTIADAEMKRAVFEALERKLPDDPYVLQHRSLLERDLDNGEAAIAFARRALRYQPTNPVFENTLGMALERHARRQADPGVANALLSEARRYFEKGRRQRPQDPYSYIGLYHVLSQDQDREMVPARKQAKRIEKMTLVEEGYESTGSHPMIAALYAEQMNELGSKEQALEILRDALLDAPQDSRIRNLLVRHAREMGQVDYAISIARQGIELNYTDWRLQWELARMLDRTSSHGATVQGHYDMAIRHRPNDYQLIMDAAMFAFHNHDLSRASELFNRARYMSGVSARDKRHWFRSWRDRESNGFRQYQGRVKSVDGGQGIVIAEPEGFMAGFPIDNLRLSSLAIGQAVRFELAFNAFGPQAVII